MLTQQQRKLQHCVEWGGEKRLAMGNALSANMRHRLEVGVQMRHPDYDEDEVRRAVLRLMIGEELFRECCPNDEIEP